MLKYDKVEWLNEPYYIAKEEVKPGMVVRFEFGDYNHYVETGVLAMNPRNNNCWHMYGERVSQTDWTTMDSAYGSGGSYELVGYFDLDEYYYDNPEKVEEVAQVNAQYQ